MDVNQKFSIGAHGDSKYTNGTPFFFELPILYTGTGTFENGSIRNDYSGNGDIAERLEGSKFTYRAQERTFASAGVALEALGVEGYYGTDADVEFVKDNPLTWTIVRVQNDLGQDCERVVINIGKLGTSDSTQGLTFSQSGNQVSSSNTYYQTRLANLIKSAQSTISTFEDGTASAVTNLDTRASQLDERISGMIGSGSNQILAEDAQPALDALASVRTWYTQNCADANARNAQLAAVPTEVANASDAITALAEKHPALKAAQQYHNWNKAASNLLADQHTYVSNLDNYLRDWNNTLVRHTLTEEFYSSDLGLGANTPVWGFVMRYRADAINPTAGTYNNSMTISSAGASETTDASGKAVFDHTVVGTFQSGSAVLQKKDAATGEALSGAQFNVFRNADDGLVLDHFADRSYSSTGVEYIWDSRGDDYTHTLVGKENVIDNLPVNDAGVLAVAGFPDAGVTRSFVEYAAPVGYYLDTTPIQFDIDAKSVMYVDAPNNTRAVKLTKASSQSETGETQMLDGATFGLYKADGTEVTGFTKRTYTNGDTGETTEYYLKSDDGTDTLITCAGGQLNITGLDAGGYYLQEKSAPSGYVADSATKYSFTLAEQATAEELSNAAVYFSENGFHYVLANFATEGEGDDAHLVPVPAPNDPVATPDPDPEPTPTPDEDGDQGNDDSGDGQGTQDEDDTSDEWSDKKADADQMPSTNDNTALPLAVGILVLALAGLAIVAWKRRR